MRVISGRAKGKKLNAPKGDDIRPTSDKIKEAIFSKLQQEIADATFVDLFSGSGAMGIEALSRGAKKVYFCDKSKSSRLLTLKNLQSCSFDAGEYEFLSGDYKTCIKRMHQDGVRGDIVYIDPPYQMEDIENIFNVLYDFPISEDGLILLEHDRKRTIAVSDECFTRTESKKYGTTMVSFYRKR